MIDEEMFDSSVRSAGDLAGVFEYDGETGYFYLYSINDNIGNKVLGAIRIFAGPTDFGEEDVAVHWGCDQSTVGLFIRGQLWAVFSSETELGYGGNYRIGTQPEIPQEVVDTFSGR